MKKKIIFFLCATLLVVALPSAAWAAPSPVGNTVVHPESGVALTVSAGSGEVTSVEATDTHAGNVQISGDEKVLASFEVKGDATDVALTFNVGTANAGATVKIFIQHSDGTTEVISGLTVNADGTVAINVDKLSVFTIVIDESTIPKTDNTATSTTTTASTDTSAKSPKTGLDFNLAAAGTAGMVVAAGVIGAILVARKKASA